MLEAYLWLVFATPLLLVLLFFDVLLVFKVPLVLQVGRRFQARKKVTDTSTYYGSLLTF
jgi:hypothetical protein